MLYEMLNKKKTLIGQNRSQRSDTKHLFRHFIGWMQVGELAANTKHALLRIRNNSIKHPLTLLLPQNKKILVYIMSQLHIYQR